LHERRQGTRGWPRHPRHVSVPGQIARRVEISLRLLQASQDGTRPTGFSATGRWWLSNECEEELTNLRFARACGAALRARSGGELLFPADFLNPAPAAA